MTNKSEYDLNTVARDVDGLQGLAKTIDTLLWQCDVFPEHHEVISIGRAIEAGAENILKNIEAVETRGAKRPQSKQADVNGCNEQTVTKLWAVYQTLEARFELADEGDKDKFDALSNESGDIQNALVSTPAANLSECMMKLLYHCQMAHDADDSIKANMAEAKAFMERKAA